MPLDFAAPFGNGRRRLVRALSMAVLLALPQVAWAEDDFDSLFAAAREANKNKEHEKAYELYTKAAAIKEAPEVVCNLGVTAAALKRPAAAARHLSHCMRIQPVNSKPEQIARVKRDFEDQKAKVGALKIEGPEGTKVSIDGTAAGMIGQKDAFFVEPGLHEIVGTLPNHKGKPESVRVAAGEDKTVKLTLVPGGGGAGGEGGGGNGGGGSGGEAGGGSSFPKVPLAVTGGILAAGALGAGIGLFVAGQDALAEAKQLGQGLPPNGCVVPSDVCTRIHDRAVAKDTFTNASIGVFVVGGVFAVATIVVAAIPSRGGEKKVTFVPRLGGATLRLDF